MDNGPGVWLPVNRGASGMDYQRQISGVPKAPDGSMMEYYLPLKKPGDEWSEVSFDGHVWRGQPPEEVYLDAKDGYYWPIIDNQIEPAFNNQLKNFTDEAKRQLDAMKQAKVVDARLEWHFSDEEVANFMREYFDKNEYDITVVYTPKI